MNAMPLVSVITVCLNEAARIESTIRSILDQTCERYEWIVLDGGSTDGTREILEKQRDRIQVFRSERDMGIYYAMNEGIALARGEFCLFMNGGDRFHDERVIERFKAFAPKADINYGGNVEIHCNGKIARKFTEPILDCVVHLYRNSLPHQATFIRRELLMRLGGYDVRFRIMSDMEFFARAIVVHKASVAHLPWFVSVYHFDGLSAKSKGTYCLRQEATRYRRMHYGQIYIAKRWIFGLIEDFRRRQAGGEGAVSQTKSSIALVMVWFGSLPFWMPAFLLSCKYNPDVTWLIFSNAEPPTDLPPNVKILPMDLETFNRRATEALGFDVRVRDDYAYKLCDLKIMYGRIFEAELREFDFWGCCDMDIVWGNIRRFMTPDILAGYDVITSRVGRISGHFCLFRNRPEWNALFQKIPGVVELVQDSETCRRIDENGLTDLLQSYPKAFLRRFWLRRVHGLPVPRVYWKRVLTPNGKHQREMLTNPELCMRWREGRTYGVHGEEMMYLHFHSVRREMKKIDFEISDSPGEFIISTGGFSSKENTR